MVQGSSQIVQTNDPAETWGPQAHRHEGKATRYKDTKGRSQMHTAVGRQPGAGQKWTLPGAGTQSQVLTRGKPRVVLS